jgi:hypothetical protein
MSLREHGIIHIKAMPETDDDYKISPEFERQLLRVGANSR